MGRESEETLSKEDIQMTNTHIERYSTSLVLRKMQIKSIMRCHSTSAKMTVI